MIQHPPSERASISWFLAWLWTGIVFATIPKARSFQKAVTEQFGPDSYIYFVLGLLTLGALFVLLYFFRNRSRFRWYHVIWLLLLASIYAKQTWELKARSPAEALHFVMYGLMFFLFFRALLHRTHDLLALPAALCLTSLCGNIDEAIQWLTPRRVFDWRDVGLNAFSGFMMLLLFLGALRPSYLTYKPTPSSVWHLITLCILHATISLLCLVNTPIRTAGIVERFPTLQRWSNDWGEMTEYGFLYSDPNIGLFKSRLSPDELQAYDLNHGLEIAQIFNTQLNMEYGDFLRTVAPVTKPYSHEIRVHLHRRGRYLKGRIEHRGHDPEEYARQTSVAVREHRILTTYFPTFMKSFHDNVNTEWLRIMESEMKQNHAYVSRVSSTLIVRFNEAKVWKVYTITLVVLLGIGVGYARGNKTQPEEPRPAPLP